MTESNKGSIVSPEVRPSAKTPAQRRAELGALIGSKKDNGISAMPKGVQELILGLEGAEIALDGQIVRTVPMASSWRNYQSKKGDTIYTCLDGFSGEKLFSKDGLTVSLKVSMSVFASK